MDEKAEKLNFFSCKAWYETKKVTSLWYKRKYHLKRAKWQKRVYGKF